MSGEYSPWIWSPEHFRHYCYRTREDGSLEYLWDTPQVAEAGPAGPGPDPHVPRTSPSTQAPANVSQAPPLSPPTSRAYTYQAQTTSSYTALDRPVQENVPRAYTYQAQATSSHTALDRSVQDSVGGDKPRRFIKTGNDGRDEERLDPNYRRVVANHHVHFFVQGRVFKMLWTEPAGRDAPGNTRGSTHFSVVRFSEQAYSEIRRFVVIQNKGTFSQCIPIQTYRGQGARKKGLLVQDHGIIYTGHPGAPPPNRLEGEGITKQALRVQSTRGEQLETQSRINFGKPYAVEHNCKVLEIGMIAPEHIHLLVYYFRQSLGAL